MELFPMKHVLIYSFVFKIMVKIFIEVSAWLKLIEMPTKMKKSAVPFYHGHHGLCVYIL